MEPWVMWLFGLALAAGLVWQVRYVHSQQLSDEEYEQRSADFLRALYKNTQGPDRYLNARPWYSTSGMNTVKQIRLVDRLVKAGRVGVQTPISPLDWLMQNPPPAVCLTPRGYDDLQEGRVRDVTIIKPTAPVQVGGTGNVQLVAGGDIRLETSALAEIALALWADAAAIDDPARRRMAEHAATILDEAVVSGEVDTPRVKSALHWAKDRLNDGVGGVLGNGMWTATVAAVTAWMS